MHNTWIRARSGEQIEQRIAEILNATTRLFDEHRFEDITLVMIAQESGFTRSNLYRYFQTKEEVFLELLRRDLDQWSRQVIDRIETVAKTSVDLAEFWAKGLRNNRRMLKLFSILYTILEPNVSLEALTSFKGFLVDMTTSTVSSVTQAFPQFSIDAAAEFLYVQASLAIGLYPLTDLTEKQCDAMDAIGMERDPELYWGMLEHAISLLVEGLMGGDEYAQ